MKRERFLRSCLLLLLCGLLPILVCQNIAAQTGTSSVRGVVTDAQGQAVAGASVTLTDTGRNFSRTQVSSDQGEFLFSALPPGSYRLEAEAKGFKKAVIGEVRALVDTPNEVNVALEVGDVSETVNIIGGTDAPLNTTDATIGNAFENRRIAQLPLNARNPIGLLSLQPGVTRTGYVNGGRADQANVLLDGVDNNEQQRGLDVVTDEAFASVLRSTPDSLQEFRVVTSNPNADQGRSSGAQVSLITKSGSNNFHGSLYEFHRNTVTTANDFFNNAAGSYAADDLPVILGQKQAGDPIAPRPQLLRNVFGGAIGGPIKKDRAFFFFTYEGFREASETPVVREVPLPNLGLGNVRYLCDQDDADPVLAAECVSLGGVRTLNPAAINAAYIAANGDTPGVNPLTLAILADAARRYPANDTSVGDGLNTGGFRFNVKTPGRLNTYITRMDFNLTDRQTLYLRGNYQQDNVTRNVYGGPDCGIDSSDNIQCFPDTAPLTIWNHPWGLAAGHTWTASPNFVNRFTYGFTRAAFTDGGESTENRVTFRFVFAPLGYRRGLSRVTPVHNFVDDVSWIKGAHTFSLGGNVRLITNNRTSFAGSFDDAIINPSYYNSSGAVVRRPFANIDPGFRNDLRDALSSVIGRYSQYSANLVYDADGSLQPVGTATERAFATEEYEAYVQDSWRVAPNLTVNFGVRWSTSTPVYEKNGIQVAPTPSLGDYFARRVESSAQGVPFNDPITFDLSGKKNNRPDYYKQDWNNFAPSVSFAWSPDLDNWFGRLIGNKNKSVIRGGFRTTYDRIGSQLAVNFDLNNLAGFTSARNINANTFDVTDSGAFGLGPLFTGFNPNVRSLTFPTATTPIPTTLSFPLTVAADEDQRIEVSLDDTITTPYNYSLNVSYARELGKGFSFEASYVGRQARKLLATRDIMQLNNLRDPQSGMSFYQAMGLLIDARYNNVDIGAIGAIPYFENLFPFMSEWTVGDNSLTPTQAAYTWIAPVGVGGFDITDYTFVQLLWDDAPGCTTCPFGGGPARVNNMFYQPQFAALSAFSTIARSNYHSAQLSLRKRFSNDFAFDLNYTLGHSLDNASGLQNSTSYGTAFIVNALNPDANYASSDFDARHIVNANWLVGIPLGRGKRFLGNSSGVVDSVLGGWQMSGIFRWNSGLPIQTPFDGGIWATNWNVQSNGVRVGSIEASPTSSGSPNIFSDPVAAYRAFRNARSGESGDRNVLRNHGYIALDMGLSKTFNMPFEGHSLQFRWEVFNVTNTQRFDANTIADLGLDIDPFLGGEPSGDFGKFTSTQAPLNETKAGRVMQFALRYQF
jgi:hypothetical protein